MKSGISAVLSAIVFAAFTAVGGAAFADAPAGPPASQPGEHRGGTPDQMADRMFGRLDTDKNGIISKDEAAKAPHPFIKEHFDEIDANHDGGISRAELVTYLQSHPMPHPQKKE